MLYISPKNEYPRHYGDIQIENPDWELGNDLPVGWKFVQEVPIPAVAEDQIAYEGFPEEIDGNFYQNWIIRPMTAEEIERRNAPRTAKEKLISLGLTEPEIQAIVQGYIY